MDHVGEMFAPVWNVAIWICRINAACVWTAARSSRLCVVEDVSDLWAIERAEIFSGLYHVLGTLSALDGRGPAELGIDRLVMRAKSCKAEDRQPEVILATSATVDGQTTAHYIAERLERRANHHPSCPWRAGRGRAEFPG